MEGYAVALTQQIYVYYFKTSRCCLSIGNVFSAAAVCAMLSAQMKQAHTHSLNLLNGLCLKNVVQY